MSYSQTLVSSNGQAAMSYSQTLVSSNGQAVMSHGQTLFSRNGQAVMSYSHTASVSLLVTIYATRNFLLDIWNLDCRDGGFKTNY